MNVLWPKMMNDLHRLSRFVRQDEAQRAFVVTMGVESGTELQNWLSGSPSNQSAFEAMLDDGFMAAAIAANGPVLSRVASSSLASGYVRLSETMVRAMDASPLTKIASSGNNRIGDFHPVGDAAAAGKVIVTSVWWSGATVTGGTTELQWGLHTGGIVANHQVLGDLTQWAEPQLVGFVFDFLHVRRRDSGLQVDRIRNVRYIPVDIS